MSLYDIAMIIVFLGAIWFGYWKGLAWQVASVASIALSYFVAITFPDAITPYISAEAPFNRFAAMLILFVGTSLIVWTLFASISKSLKKMELKGFDRQAGAILGAFKGAVLCMVITMFAFSLLGDKARDAIHQSKSGYYVVNGIDQLPSVLPTDVYDYVHKYVENFRSGIRNPDGSLPTRNPIFDREGEQQVNDQGQFGVPGNYQYGQNQGQGGQPTQWQQTPATQAGYQQPAQGNSTQQQQQWQGNYQSGTFGGSNQPQSSGGFQQGTFGGQQQQPQTQWQQPNNQNQQFPNSNQQWQPPQTNSTPNQQTNWGQQFPKISEGENGWPNVQFNVNSKELLQKGADAALDAGKQWLENQRQ